MASHLGLNDAQLKSLRSWLQNERNLNPEHSVAELKMIDCEAGASTENEPACSACNCCWDNKDAETCRHWSSELAAEAEGVEMDTRASRSICEAKGKGTELTEIPTLDHSLPGLPGGCAALLDGDHW